MEKIGKYKIIKRLGSGGNGIVWLVEDSCKQFALKTLKDFSKTNKYSRFRDEVGALKKIGPIANIIPILDSNLPETPAKEDLPFYTMPVGIPIKEYLTGKSHEFIFNAFLKIIKAIAVLHKMGFTHRDIKPDNILFIDEEPVISDFGLVSFPNKEHKSDNDEKIGPQWTIAPEMQRNSSTAEFKKADVYSLAKTLWILLTGSKFGFEGQYIPNSNISLDNYVEMMVNKTTNAGQWYYFSTVILDRLLQAATDNDPEKRPSAEQFFKGLDFWMQSNVDFKLRNPYEWEAALEMIFPYDIPEKCEWTNPQQIHSVLEILTKYDNLNHFFYPNRGGSDMKSVEYVDGKKAIVINGDEMVYPEKLIFRNVGGYPLCYFRLFCKVIEPVTNDFEDGREDFWADSDYNYAGSIEEEAEGNVKKITRYLKGSFIFVQKSSKINAIRGSYKEGLFLDGYSAIHEKIPEEEYDLMLSVYRDNN